MAVKYIMIHMQEINVGWQISVQKCIWKYCLQIIGYFVSVPVF